LARFYTDEDFPASVVFELRQLGHDVLTAKEAGKANQRIPDHVVLADAFAAGRILLTQNRRHFRRLHKAGNPHVGIILCKLVPDDAKYARLIDAKIASAPPHGRSLLSVNRGG
jgi:predicted nuclease of predicted toxin-antitoxin system